MRSLLSRALFGALSLSFSSAHPTRYPHAPADVNCSNAPPVLSYHMHVVFSLTSDVQVAAAIALRNAARAHFAPYLGADCDGRYDNARLCMILDHNITQPLVGGPFPSGEWSIFTPVQYYSAVLGWATQHYQGAQQEREREERERDLLGHVLMMHARARASYNAPPSPLVSSCRHVARLFSFDAHEYWL